jgi:hypothetical protein
MQFDLRATTVSRRRDDLRLNRNSLELQQHGTLRRMHETQPSPLTESLAAEIDGEQRKWPRGERIWTTVISSASRK